MLRSGVRFGCAALSSGARVVAVRGFYASKQASTSCMEREGKGLVVCSCRLLCVSTVLRLRAGGCMRDVGGGGGERLTTAPAKKICDCQCKVGNETGRSCTALSWGQYAAEKVWEAQSLSHSVTLSLSHSPTHPPTHSLPHSLPHSSIRREIQLQIKTHQITSAQPPPARISLSLRRSRPRATIPPAK